MADPFALMEFQHAEHAAWLLVVSELRRAGVGDINRGGQHERLHDVIVLWGEELAQLRLADPNPDHAVNALAERREKWAKDWGDR